MNELELIRYPQIEGCNLFFNTVDYRTPHLHPEWEMIWVLENTLVANCGMEEFVLEPGQLILFNSNEPHEFHKLEEPATFLCLQISPAILPKLPAVHVDGKLLHRYLEPDDIVEIKQELTDCMEHYLRREDNFTLYCLGKAYLILYQLLYKLPGHIPSLEEADSMDKRNERLRRLIAYVDDNYMRKIRLTDFAESEHCSVSYLSRFIKSTLNQTFQEYVTSVRFHCACKMMLQEEGKLLDICFASGFSDYRYFSREFRKQYHMTPEAYRNSMKLTMPERMVIRHSLHSVERFYSREESLQWIERIRSRQC